MISHKIWFLFLLIVIGILCFDGGPNVSLSLFFFEEQYSAQSSWRQTERYPLISSLLVCVCVFWFAPNFDAFCSVLWIKKWVCMYMMPQVWCSYFWYIKHYLAFLYTLKLGYSYLSFFLFINAFLLLWFEATVFLSSLFLFSLVCFPCTASTFFCSMKSLVSFVTLVFPFGY